MPDLKGTNEVSNLNEQMRAEFEQFRRSTGTPDYLLVRADGEYCFAVVNADWTIWQAATEAANRRQHGSAAQAVGYVREVQYSGIARNGVAFEAVLYEGGKFTDGALLFAAPPVADAEGWKALDALESYFSRESVGYEKCQVLRAALSRRPAAVTEATELQQELEDFDIERTGDERYDASNFLLNAAQEFWQACHNAGQYGGVQWLTGTGGELLIYTRGEYRDQLMRNIAVLDCQKEYKFPPAAEVAAEQPAAAGNALTDKQIDALGKANGLPMMPLAGDFPWAYTEKVRKLVRAIEQHLRAAPQAAPLAGRTVSVDVSTGEGDATNRIFAELTGETGSDGKTLLAIESSRNFAAAQGEGLTVELVTELWDAQRQYHGGEPCKLGHLEFANAIAAHTRAAGQDGKDGELLDRIELWNEANRKRGFCWNSIHLDSDKPIRDQLDKILPAAAMQAKSAQGGANA